MRSCDYTAEGETAAKLADVVVLVDVWWLWVDG
jgi:hypothetical protein